MSLVKLLKTLANLCRSNVAPVHRAFGPRASRRFAGRIGTQGTATDVLELRQMLSATSTVPSEADQNRLLNDAMESVRRNLATFAQSGDFEHDMKTAFGSGVTTSVAQSWARAWRGNTLQMPSVVIVAPGVLQDVWAGYVSSTNTILVSRSLLTSADVSVASSVLLEEYGHSVDARINRVDTPGDEGHLFAGLVMGRSYTATELSRLRAVNDQQTIQYGNQSVTIEHATVSGDGGKGGTTKTLALSPGLNLVRFQWENYSIPDEFQILYRGKRIAGDVGLQSGGHSGQTIVTADNSSDQLTVKVTAPLDGTAWNFVVEALPFELNFDGYLGDLVKVDVVKALQSAGVNLADAGLKADDFALKSESNNRGAVAKIDNYQQSLKKGQFYFAPTLIGAALDYKAEHTDVGLGDSTLTLTNNGKEIQIKLHVRDGYSSSGEGAVTFGTKKLDIYRQEQRLAYLGYPTSSGGSITVDGAATGDANWAKKVFNVAANPATSGYGTVVNQSNETYFKQYINSQQAPQWVRLAPISGLTFAATARTFGTNATARMLENAASTLGQALVSTGSALRQGTAPPSVSHDAGRGVDIDDAPGNFFNEVTKNQVSYVASPGGKVITLDGSNYRVGDPAKPADLANAVRTSTLVNTKDSTLVTAISALIDYKLTETYARSVLDALIAAGSTVILYNDPRFINGTTIKFHEGHFNHIHAGVPSASAGGSASFAPSQNSFIASQSPSAVVIRSSPPSSGVSLADAQEISSFDGLFTVNGVLDSVGTDRIYRVQIGTPDLDFDERPVFDTLRDLSIGLSALTADADLELIADNNSNLICDDGEVILSSEQAGLSGESISALDLSTGYYFVRVIRRAAETNFRLDLTIPPLPVPPDHAGNLVTNAADLGALAGASQHSDFVGVVDAADYYRFNFTSLSDLNVLVDGLAQGDVSLAVGQDLNGDGVLDPGEYLGFSDEEGSTPESLHRERMNPGEYLIVIQSISGSTDYRLHIDAVASTVPPDIAGQTLGTAHNLGGLSGPVERTDFVGDVDPLDCYQFAIPQLRSLHLTLTELHGDADIAIGRDDDNNGVLEDSEILMVSQAGGDGDETIELGGLPAGTYFVQVLSYLGDTTYRMTVTPGAPVGADLSISRTDTTTGNLGGQFTYSIQVTNSGPDPAVNVVLTEKIPTGLTFVNLTNSDQGSSAQIYETEAIGTLASLQPGASSTFHFTVESFISGQLPTQTSVTSDAPDFDLRNNVLADFKVVDQIVSPKADLELTQSASNLSPKSGESVTLTLTLSNKGPGTATVVKVRDLLPTGLTWTSSFADLGQYDPVSGVWDVGNMPSGSSVQLMITATVTGSSSLVNTAEIVGVDEGDPDSTPNNQVVGEDDLATVTLSSGPPIDIQVTQVAALADASNKLKISYQITRGSAAPFSFGVYGSTNSRFDGADTRIGSLLTVSSPGDLTPGNHVFVVDGRFLVPGLADLNNAYILVTADPENRIGETTKTNNTRILTGIMSVTSSAASEQLFVRSDDQKARVSVRTAGKQIVASLNGASRTLLAAKISQIIIVTGAASDTITTSTEKAVWVSSGAGDDSVTTGRGNDVVNSGSGNDFIQTDGGNDRISSGDGRDTVNAGAGDDVVDAGSGDDVVTAGAGNDLVRGGTGRDRLNGNAGNDILLGDDGDDSLFDSFGMNITIGGRGADDQHGYLNGNLLIAGSTTFDANDVALRSILAEWTSGRTLDRRIVNLSRGGGLNGTNVLVKGTTVLDDAATDKLFGGVKEDWFLYFPGDKVLFERSNDRP